MAGTTANVTDATWVLTRGAKTTDGTATWQECTGASAVNGDLTNTPNWTTVKAGGGPTLGAIIKRNNSASYQICTTASASQAASEPAFSDTAGVTTTDGSAVWTSLGVVGNFTGGQAPHARLERACTSTWFAAGNTIYVGNNHAESQTTTLTPVPASSASTMGKVICHNSSGSYPPAAGDITTGATISTTAGVSISFTIGGGFYLYGLTFRVGVGQSSSNNINLSTSGGWVLVDNCVFDIANTGSAGTLVIGAGSPSSVTFNNTTVKFSNTGQRINLQNNQFIWQNTGQVLVSGSSVPATFIFPITQLGPAVLEALDLSQLSGVLVSSSTIITNLLIKDCKLHASATFDVPLAPGITLQTVRCDSGAGAYKSSRITYEGTETTETSITRVGGATDPTGQAQSRKIVTTANSQWLRPFKAEPYAIWNSVTGANVTVTVYGAINSDVLPFNDDIWIEVEYLGASGSPLGTIVTTTKANLLAANAAVASDSSSWSGFVTTLDDTPTPTNCLMSNGNLTATWGAVSSGGVGSLSALSAGKYYIEYAIGTVATSTSDTIGFKLLSQTGLAFVTTSGGLAACQVGNATGTININGAASGTTLGSFPAGSVLCVAIDLDNYLIWFRKNNGNWNNNGSANPATGVGGLTITSGPMVPAVGFGTGGSSKTFTANFGASSYTYTAPSGFGNWNVQSKFKLTAILSAPQPGLAGYIHVRVRAAKASAIYYIDPQVALS